MLQLAGLLWLIQRDFLEGTTVQELVHDALAEKPNSSGDKNIAALNKVRQSLLNMHAKHEAFGLKQPHLERTKLCDLPEASLDPGYVQQISQLRELVVRLTKPKKVGGANKALTGSQFADFFEKAAYTYDHTRVLTPR